MPRAAEALVLDLTQDGHLLLGLQRRGAFAHQVVRLPRGHHERVLPAVLAFLNAHGSSLATLPRLVVVAGPGRFSSVRIASVIANVARWARRRPLQLATVRALKTEATLPPADRLRTQVGRAKATKVVTPLYGAPPSITRPRRR